MVVAVIEQLLPLGTALSASFDTSKSECDEMLSSSSELSLRGLGLHMVPLRNSIKEIGLFFVLC